MEWETFNRLQFFGSWSITVLCAVWISVEVYLWSRFLGGIKTWFFRSIVVLLLLYAVYNGGLIVLSLMESFDWAQIATRQFGAVEIQRMYSHAVIPLAVAVLTRIVNSRSASASEEEKIIILSASEILAQSKKERDRAERVEKRINEYIHLSDN